MKLIATLIAASVVVGGSAATAAAQSPAFGSLGSVSGPSAPASSLPHTATTQSGLTVKYRVEDCDGSFRVVGKLSTTTTGYFWVNYTGLVNGEAGGQPVYKKIPLYSLFLDPGYETDEIPLGGAGTVKGSGPASLTFGFDPFGPGGIINLPDSERSVTVPIDYDALQRCS